MKRFDSKKLKNLFFPAIGLVALSAAGFTYSVLLGAISVVLSAFVLLFIILVYCRIEVNFSEQENDDAYKIVFEMDMPVAIVNSNGIITWNNKALAVLSKAQPAGLHIKDICPVLAVRWDKPADGVEISGRHFATHTMRLQIPEDPEATLIYFEDKTQVVELSRRYTQSSIVVIFLQIDNYDELMSATESIYQGVVIAETGKLLGEYFKRLGAFCIKFERDKFIVGIGEKGFESMQRNRFALLDNVRDLNVGNGIKITLSIGVGISKSPDISAAYAQQALDIALGRGGDQAAVKNGDKLSFYGGKMKTVEKRAKVKSRIMAHALKNLMQNSSRILIMGHNDPDPDCLGASLGLFRCALSIDKYAQMVWNGSNAAVDSLIDELMKDSAYDEFFITPDQAQKAADLHTLLIVVDTQVPGITICPELLEKCGVIAIIDHHRRGVNYIENATLAYLEPYSSSACELVTEMVQYFEDGIKLKALESEALLSGIMVGTKSFSIKTGVRTFEAAAYLKRVGADISSAHRLVQDDLETFNDRAGVVKSARMLTDGIAIAICPKIKNRHLVAAQAADTLLTIKGIHTSFVLSESDGVVMVSGRSLGMVNVQLILEKLGGGGHLTMAGTKLYDVTVEEGERLVTDGVNAYLKEVKEK